MFDQSGQKFKMSWTMDNITVIISKITELYGFVAFAFKKEVGWSWSDSQATTTVENTSSGTGVQSNYYIYMYWG